MLQNSLQDPGWSSSQLRSNPALSHFSSLSALESTCSINCLHKNLSQGQNCREPDLRHITLPGPCGSYYKDNRDSNTLLLFEEGRILCLAWHLCLWALFQDTSLLSPPLEIHSAVDLPDRPSDQDTAPQLRSFKYITPPAPTHTHTTHTK